MHSQLIKWSVFLVLYFSISTCTFPQSYLTRGYSEKDGLPSLTVHDVTQDLQGRIWAATRSGIACYDGIAWKSYTLADGLPELPFAKITVDRKGKIWALSDSTQNLIYVIYFDGIRWHQIAELKILPQKFPEITFFQLIERKQRDKPLIAVGTSNCGIYLWNRGKWKNITEQSGLLSSFVNGIALFKGKYYVATDNGLSIMNSDLTIDNRLNRLLHLPSTKIKSIAVEYKDKYPDYRLKHSRLWLFNHQWIGYFEEIDNKLKWTSYPVEMVMGKKMRKVTLLPDYRGGIYIGNHYELNYFHYKSRSWESMDVNNGLIGAGANSMFIDFEKSIWIACDRGISKIYSRRFGNFQMMHGLLEDEVTAVLEYEPGAFVLGHNYGVTFYDGKKFLKIPFPRKEEAGVPLCRVLDMQVDAKKNIWLALAWAGLAKIDTRNKQQIKWYGKAEGLPDYVVSLWFDKETGNLWIGTGQGIYVSRENRDGFMLRKIKINPVPGTPRRIQGFSGKLRYFGDQDHGLYVYLEDENKWKNYRVPGDRKANSVYAVRKVSSGRLLVGTLKGLFVLENQRIEKFKVKNFQVDRPVYFILEDNKNRLWFGTDNGVVRWDGKEERSYSIDEGLIGQETNRAAAIIDSRGRTWFGTSRGVSVYNDDFDSSLRHIPAPKVQLLYVEVQDKKIPLKEPLQLNHKNNTLTFHFRGISFIDEASIRFRSKLEGFETQWSGEYYPYNQMKRYINLPVGTYRFHLKVGNAVGIWSEAVTSPAITILQPWYKRWWFFLSLFLLAVFLFYSIFRFFSEKQQAALLKKLVDERTRQLQEVEQSYRTLFEESKDVVFISTPDGKLIDINPAGVELFGYTSKDEILTEASVIGFYNNPGDRAAFREAIEEKGYVKDYELVYKRRDGDQINGWVTATVVRDNEGKITAYRGIIRDITEKKRLEQRLMQAQKMEAIGTLAGGIAHDFNNILGLILGYTEVALDKLPRRTPERREIEHVKGAAERAADLVKQILAFSRQDEQARRPLNLGALVTEALKLLRSSLPSTIEIRRDIRTAADVVLADPTQIHQVMMNLGSNAAHAMRENGGVLEVILDEVYLDEETAKRHSHIKSGSYLKLTVSDTGHGISREVVKRIFEPYFTTKKTGEGTGMGLAVIHGIVKSHGGDITVYSEPGKGASFHVFLPQTEKQVETRIRLKEKITGGSERILLVDDELLLAVVQAQMLEGLGYNVVEESNPEDALEIFRKNPDQFDLVITDLTMPYMTGVQLAEKIRHIKPGIPIILCSGFSDTTAREKIKALGASDFVAKPIVKYELARAVRRILDNR